MQQGDRIALQGGGPVTGVDTIEIRAGVWASVWASDATEVCWRVSTAAQGKAPAPSNVSEGVLPCHADMRGAVHALKLVPIDDAMACMVLCSNNGSIWSWACQLNEALTPGGATCISNGGGGNRRLVLKATAPTELLVAHGRRLQAIRMAPNGNRIDGQLYAVSATNELFIDTNGGMLIASAVSLGISFAQVLVSGAPYDSDVCVISGTYGGEIVGWTPVRRQQGVLCAPTVVWRCRAHRPGCVIMSLSGCSAPVRCDSGLRRTDLWVTTASDDRSAAMFCVTTESVAAEARNDSAVVRWQAKEIWRAEGPLVAKSRLRCVATCWDATIDGLVVCLGGEDGTVQSFQVSPAGTSAALLWRCTAMFPPHGCSAIGCAIQVGDCVPGSGRHQLLITSCGFNGCVMVHSIPIIPMEGTPLVRQLSIPSASGKLRCLTFAPHGCCVLGVTDRFELVILDPLAPSLRTVPLVIEGRNAMGAPYPKASHIVCTTANTSSLARHAQSDTTQSLTVPLEGTTLRFWIGCCDGTTYSATVAMHQQIDSDAAVACRAVCASKSAVVHMATTQVEWCGGTAVLVCGAVAPHAQLMLERCNGACERPELHRIIDVAGTYGPDCSVVRLSDPLLDGDDVLAAVACGASKGGRCCFSWIRNCMRSDGSTSPSVCVWTGTLPMPTTPGGTKAATGRAADGVDDIVLQWTHRREVLLATFCGAFGVTRCFVTMQQTLVSLEVQWVDRIQPLSFPWHVSRLLHVSMASSLVVSQHGTSVSVHLRWSPVERCHDGHSPPMDNGTAAAMQRSDWQLVTSFHNVATPRILAATSSPNTGRSGLCVALVESPNGSDVVVHTVATVGADGPPADGMVQVCVVQPPCCEALDGNACAVVALPDTASVVVCTAGEATHVRVHAPLGTGCGGGGVLCGGHNSNVLGMAVSHQQLGLVDQANATYLLSVGSLSTVCLWRYESKLLEVGHPCSLAPSWLLSDRWAHHSTGAAAQEGVPRYMCIATGAVALHPFVMHGAFIGSSSGTVEVVAIADGALRHVCSVTPCADTAPRPILCVAVPPAPCGAIAAAAGDTHGRLILLVAEAVDVDGHRQGEGQAVAFNGHVCSVEQAAVTCVAFVGHGDGTAMTTTVLCGTDSGAVVVVHAGSTSPTLHRAVHMQVVQRLHVSFTPLRSVLVTTNGTLHAHATCVSDGLAHEVVCASSGVEGADGVIQWAVGPCSYVPHVRAVAQAARVLNAMVVVGQGMCLLPTSV